MAEGLGGKLLAAQHASDFFGTRAGIELFDFGHSATGAFEFFDAVVMVGEAGDLGKVGDAEYLVFRGEGFEASGYTFGSAATNAGVDLVEDESARSCAG